LFEAWLEKRSGPDLVILGHMTGNEIRQAFLDYFAERDYRLVGRYLRADPDNLWFTPVEAAIPPGVGVAHPH